jgi:hypothetical protein
MSLIRPFEAGDIDRVAALYNGTFAGSAAKASTGLAQSLKEFYLEGPSADPDIPSLVHVGDGGAISGFVGVNVVPMAFNSRQMKAAFCGALMVEDPKRDPLAGARLLKRFLSGRQDMSISETANKTSLEMSKALKGIAFPGYSLEWMRAFTPASFACDVVFRHSPLRKVALPVAQGIDRLVRWSGLDRGLAVERSGVGKSALALRAVDANGFAEAVEFLTTHYPLRPCWSSDDHGHVVSQAFDKPRYGEPVAMVASKGEGHVVGAFLYHLPPRGVGRVFQVLALPGMESRAIDCMFADAARRGAAGLRGRTQPAILNGLLGKKAMFANASSTVVFSCDEDILDCFRGGRAFVNGIAGESWGRHIGGDF